MGFEEYEGFRTAFFRELTLYWCLAGLQPRGYPAEEVKQKERLRGRDVSVAERTAWRELR